MASSLPPTRYERLVEILERYIPRSTMMSMLKAVFDERGIVARQMSAEEMIMVVEEVMIGIRLFRIPARIPELMLELAELCDQELRAADVARSQPPGRLPTERPQKA
jgi:hypothetical protein